MIEDVSRPPREVQSHAVPLLAGLQITHVASRKRSLAVPQPPPNPKSTSYGRTPIEVFSMNACMGKQPLDVLDRKKIVLAGLPERPTVQRRINSAILRRPENLVHDISRVAVRQRLLQIVSN